MQRFLKTLHLFFHHWKWSLSIILLTTIFWIFLWPSMLVQKADGFFAGHPFVWADWSWHLAQTTWFSEHPLREWLSCFPIYACAPLNYPFLANAISGILFNIGMPLTSAMTTSSLFESIILVAFITILFAKITNKDHATALAVLLFLCSGGLGFWQQLFEKGLIGVWQMQEYSHFTQLPEKGIEFTNIVVGMLIPQRAFLLGALFALPALLTLWKFSSEKVLQLRYFLLLYCCLAILPIAHTHSFLVVSWIAIWLAFGNVVSEKTWSLRAQRARKWLFLGIPSILLSFLTYWFFLKSPQQTLPFLSFHIGWLAKPEIWQILNFWWNNWGIFFILSIIGTFTIDRKNKSLLFWVCGFWSLFLISNVIQFQPQIWDNSKFFAWVYLGLSPIASTAILKLKNFSGLGKWLAVCSLIIACGSGLADLSLILSKTATPVQMFSTAQVELAETVKKTIPRNAIFLTSEYPTNPISSLSGRAIVLGYSGWIFSYGMPYLERQSDVGQMFEGNEKTNSLLKKYNVDYVLIGENEQSLNPNTTYFSESFPTIFSNSAGKIFDVRSFSNN